MSRLGKRGLLRTQKFTESSGKLELNSLQNICLARRETDIPIEKSTIVTAIGNFDDVVQIKTNRD